MLSLSNNVHQLWQENIYLNPIAIPGFDSELQVKTVLQELLRVQHRDLKLSIAFSPSVLHWCWERSLIAQRWRVCQQTDTVGGEPEKKGKLSWLRLTSCAQWLQTHTHLKVCGEM